MSIAILHFISGDSERLKDRPLLSQTTGERECDLSGPDLKTKLLEKSIGFNREIVIESLAVAILKTTDGLPEGFPISAKMLLHLGSRAAINQSLSRLTRKGKLLRSGVAYMFAQSKAGLESIRRRPRS